MRAVAAQKNGLDDEERQQARVRVGRGPAPTTADASPPSQGPNSTATGNVTARPGHARTRLSRKPGFSAKPSAAAEAVSAALKREPASLHDSYGGTEASATQNRPMRYGLD